MRVNIFFFLSCSSHFPPAINRSPLSDKNHSSESFFFHSQSWEFGWVTKRRSPQSRTTEEDSKVAPRGPLEKHCRRDGVMEGRVCSLDETVSEFLMSPFWRKQWSCRQIMGEKCLNLNKKLHLFLGVCKLTWVVLLLFIEQMDEMLDGNTYFIFYVWENPVFRK